MTDIPITIHYQQMEEWLNDRKAVFARKYKKPYLSLVALAPQLVQLVQYDLPALQRQIRKESNALSECHRICEEAEVTKSKMCKKQAEMLISYELVTNDAPSTSTDNVDRTESTITTLSECDISAKLVEFDLDAALDKRIALARHHLAIAMMQFVREHVTEFSVEYNNIVKEQMGSEMNTRYDPLQHHFSWLHRLLEEIHLPLREANVLSAQKVENREGKEAFLEETVEEAINGDDNNPADYLPSIDWGDDEKTVEEQSEPLILTEEAIGMTISGTRTTDSTSTTTNICTNNTKNEVDTIKVSEKKESEEVIEIRWDAADDDNVECVNPTTITSTKLTTDHSNDGKCDKRENVTISQCAEQEDNNDMIEQQYVSQLIAECVDLPEPLFVSGVEYVSVDLARSRDRSHLQTELRAMKCFCEVREKMGELKNSARLTAIEELIENLMNSKDAEFVRMWHNYRLRDNFTETLNSFGRAVSAATQRQVSHQQKIHEVEAELQRLQPELTQLCHKAKKMRDEAITHVESMFPGRTVIIAGDINKYLLYCND